MNYFYFDASALAKRYCRKSGTGLINTIFENVESSRMMCLLLGASEVVSVLVRKMMVEYQIGHSHKLSSICITK